MKKLRTVEGLQVVTWSFTRKNAERKLRHFKSIQSVADYSNLHDRQQWALKWLEDRGVQPNDRLVIRRRGKWDRRYEIVIN